MMAYHQIQALGYELSRKFVPLGFTLHALFINTAGADWSQWSWEGMMAY
jgi:hypothetical protein